MDEQKQALVEKLKGANNILVTVSANPSLDQLSAAIGFTLYLNKLKKHATAVFSGEVPSKLGFLQPEDTLEKTTDSLRDFIISLDKAKADKLRYKVEENVVKIFITPYRTSLTKDDLEFGQGDFNVDLVLALGVHEQQDLDQAIVAHGRILHDATVASVNVHPGPELGSINWVIDKASSLSELAVELCETINKDELDGQIATALLTGIVAETERFSNDKTSPETMRLSAELLSVGANQQLVSTELQKAEKPVEKSDEKNENTESSSKPNDGTIEINHLVGSDEDFLDVSKMDGNVVDGTDAIKDIKQNTFDYAAPDAAEDAHSQLPPQVYVGDTPSQQGQMTANTQSEEHGLDAEPTPEVPLLGRNKTELVVPTDFHPEGDPVAQSVNQKENSDSQLLDQLQGLSSLPDTPEPAMELPTPAASLPSAQPVVDQKIDAKPAPSAPDHTETPAPTTLEEIEKAVHSPHVNDDKQPEAEKLSAEPDLDAALKAVQDVYNSTPVSQQSMPPKQDLAASGYFTVQDLPDFQQGNAADKPPLPFVPEPKPGNTPADTPLTMPLPPTSALPGGSAPVVPTEPDQGSTPPPVPPPLPPTMTLPH